MVIDSQAGLHRVTEAAAQGQTLGTGCRDDAAEHRQAERIGRMIDIAQGRTASTRAIFLTGSTRTCFIGDRSITSPPSTVPEIGYAMAASTNK